MCVSLPEKNPWAHASLKTYHQNTSEDETTQSQPITLNTKGSTSKIHLAIIPAGTLVVVEVNHRSWAELILQIETEQGGVWGLSDETRVLITNKGDENANTTSTSKQNLLGEKLENVVTQASEANNQEHDALQKGGSQHLLERNLCAQASLRCVGQSFQVSAFWKLRHLQYQIPTYVGCVGGTGSGSSGPHSEGSWVGLVTGALTWHTGTRLIVTNQSRMGATGVERLQYVVHKVGIGTQLHRDNPAGRKSIFPVKYIPKHSLLLMFGRGGRFLSWWETHHVFRFSPGIVGNKSHGHSGNASRYGSSKGDILNCITLQHSVK